MKNAQYLSHYVNACQNHTEVLLQTHWDGNNKKRHTITSVIQRTDWWLSWVKWVKVGKRYKIPHIK